MQRICAGLVIVVAMLAVITEAQTAPVITPPSRGRPAERIRTENDTNLWNSRTLPSTVIPENPFARTDPAVELRLKAKKRMALTSDEKKAFSDLLDQPKTGAIRLQAETDCSGIRLVNDEIDETCLNNFLPGKGAAYSFRKKDYALKELGDIHINGDVFDSPGIFTLALFAALEETEIASVSLGLKTVNDLLSFAPPTSVDEIKRYEQTSVKGFALGAAYVTRTAPIVENKTYLLRLIAYKAHMKVNGKSELTHNNDPQRKDILIAFAVVKRDAKKGMILLWKELSRKEAPEIELNISEFNGDANRLFKETHR
jgi:hypothetical protein